VLGHGADGEHAGQRGRIREPRARGVARGGDDEDAVQACVAERGGDERDLARRVDRRVELEREVDHLGAVIDRVADALGDRLLVAIAVVIEHLHRHDRRAVREPGLADRVVRRLGDRARDVRAVAVGIVGIGVLAVARVAVRPAVRAEVTALGEAVAAEIGRAPERAAILVRDAGVENGDLDALAAGPALGDQVVPRARRVHGEEVPLVVHPAAGLPAAARIVGLERPGDRESHGKRAH
jgi:hypothetical protein